jgi:hypothetical protein
VLPLAGRLAGAKRTQQGSRPRGFQLRHLLSSRRRRRCLSGRQHPDNRYCEVAPGSPESLARGMLSSGLPVNPGELTTSPEPGESVQPDPNGTRSQGNEGVPREANRPSARSTCHQGRPEAAGRGRRAVVRTHSTGEGGEPQGSRKGRPRYPLEGRGEQVDASTRSRIRETQNSRTDVKWNTVD